MIFITEYMSSGSLKQFLKKTKKNHKTMNEKVTLTSFSSRLPLLLGPRPPAGAVLPLSTEKQLPLANSEPQKDRRLGRNQEVSVAWREARKSGKYLPLAVKLPVVGVA